MQDVANKAKKAYKNYHDQIEQYMKEKTKLHPEAGADAQASKPGAE